MKKRLLAVLIAMTIVLSGCSVFRMEDSAGSSKNVAAALGFAYPAGTYSMDGATCTGYVTSSQTSLYLAIPVSRKILDGQTIGVTSVTGASLRINGKYVLEDGAELTPYISSAQAKNDGAVLFVLLKNGDKWMDSSNKEIANNSAVTGIMNIVFTVSDS